MRWSRPMASATVSTSAPAPCHRSAMELMNEIFVARNAFELVEVRGAGFPGGGADADEDDLPVRSGRRRVGRHSEAAGIKALADQLGQAGLVERDFAAPDGPGLLDVVVHAEHVVPDVGE